MAEATAAETSAKMLLSLTVIQLSGWNIQWAKTSLEPTQQLYYLGFTNQATSKVFYGSSKVQNAGATSTNLKVR